MKNCSWCLLLCFLQLLSSCAGKQIYVVYFGHHKGDKAPEEIVESHHSYLYSVKATQEDARNSLLYSYTNAINGFAALLTEEEASELSGLEDVLSVFPSQEHFTQTTRSWEFVGLDEEDWFGVKVDTNPSGKALLREAKYGKNIIVGVLDSGVWPESRSFGDEGMGPIPESWRGFCQSGDSFNSSNCNRKIIGARFYSKGFEQYYGSNFTHDSVSPRDMDGHGTHTASIVAGNRVRNASAYGGYAGGVASGGAPLAHLAIYKACWAIPGKEKVDGNACMDADLLAAIDDAVADGVHVLSISIGNKFILPYRKDGIAIGALHATKANIVVVCAAGNNGSHPASLSNPAPWIITVGASSVDRAFVSPVVLGSGKTIKGQSITASNHEPRMLPLVFAADVVKPGVAENVSSQCLPDSLSPEKVSGKIVLCMRGQGFRVGKGIEVKRAGGAGFILGNTPANGSQLTADSHVLPAAHITADDAIAVRNYIKTNPNATALIQSTQTLLNYKPAPLMGNFTSRGPNIIDPNILKPDITAPGINILAAWSGADPPSKISTDDRIVEYNIMTGTSMAAPHVAAAAALLRAIHPDWSSAAIRSAIMTTASVTNNLGKPITDETGKPTNSFQYGSGHISPDKAADPGLVYDASYEDYVEYLNHYKTRKRAKFDLNYPSIAIPTIKTSVTITRTVTNVGPRNVYRFAAIPPAGFRFEASPTVLSFDAAGQKRNFTIKITAEDKNLAKSIYKEDYAFGWYAWRSQLHNVRSPVAVSLTPDS